MTLTSGCRELEVVVVFVYRCVKVESPLCPRRDGSVMNGSKEDVYFRANNRADLKRIT